MFRGANLLTVDAKGRIAVPARYRQTLTEMCGGQLVMTVDQARCLLLYPLPTWAEIEKKLQQLPAYDRNARRLQRFLVGHATELEMDRQGRVLVPQVLRDFAGIDRRAMLVGQINKFELWDETAWDAQWQEPPGEDDFDLPEGFASLTL